MLQCVIINKLRPEPRTFCVAHASVDICPHVSAALMSAIARGAGSAERNSFLRTIAGQITKACEPHRLLFRCKLVYWVIIGANFDFRVVRDVALRDHQIEGSKN